jgi:hypothetical protein
MFSGGRRGGESCEFERAVALAREAGDSRHLLAMMVGPTAARITMAPAAVAEVLAVSIALPKPPVLVLAAAGVINACSHPLSIMRLHDLGIVAVDVALPRLRAAGGVIFRWAAISSRVDVFDVMCGTPRRTEGSHRQRNRRRRGRVHVWLRRYHGSRGAGSDVWPERVTSAGPGYCPLGLVRRCRRQRDRSQRRGVLAR